MNGKITVIVPVYNVAAYLPQCIESVLSQDYKNLEVILIDDGSTDESGMICDRYARQDSRVHTIHQKNGGAAAAKNTGLRSATGEYLSFVDSDDFLEPGAYGYMEGLLRETGADIVQCAFRDVYRNRTENRIMKPGRKVVGTVDYLTFFTEGDWSCSLLWDKLYKRVVFDGIFFEEDHKIDDEYFTYQGIMNARKVVCDDRIVYNYRKRASSVMQAPESQKQIVLDRIDYTAKRREKVIARFPELRRRFDYYFISYLTFLSRDPGSSVESLTKIKEQLLGYFRAEKKTVAKPHHWPRLLQLVYTAPEKLLAACQQEAPAQDVQELFP